MTTPCAILKTEIDSARRTIASTTKLAVSCTRINVANQRAELEGQFLQKLTTIGTGMTSSECADLMEALSEQTAPYEGDGMSRIVSAIDDIKRASNEVQCSKLGGKSKRKAVGGGVCGGGGQVDEQHGQDMCANMVRFLTKKDWAQLNDPNLTLEAKQEVIARRFRRLGLKFASQQTRKWVSGLLAIVAYDAFPSYDTVYRINFGFHQTMQSVCGNATYPWALMPSFPDTPRELAAEMYDAAYDPDDPPVDQYIDKLADVVKNHCPARSNSKLLRQPRPLLSQSQGSTDLVLRDNAQAFRRQGTCPTLNLSPPQAGGDIVASLAQLLPKLVATVVAEVCKHQQPDGQPGGGTRVGGWEPASKLPPLADGTVPEQQGNKPPTGAAAASDQQGDGRATGETPTTLCASPDVGEPKKKVQPGVRAYETAAMQGLKAKADAAAKRKATEGRGRGSTPAAGKGRARGRGVPSSVVKGPKAVAAADVGVKPLKVDLSQILVTKLAKSLSRNAFGCRGDAAATKTWKASGASDAVHKATKRACWQACGNLWDKVHPS